MSIDTARPRQKAILVGILLPQVSAAEHQASLTELGRLVKTLGFEVIGTLSQRRQSLAGGTVLGDGKLRELARLTGGTGVVAKKVFAKQTKAAAKFASHAEEEEELLDDGPEVAVSPAELANAVVFDCELSPSQQANLQAATGAEVLDRTGVIIEIFSRHAKTREARLQVEMARLKYLAPRLREAGAGADRISKAGESSAELDRRKIRDRLAELRQEIQVVHQEQSVVRSGRAEENCVALVGYTNAGKSSLLRALTGSEVLVADKLFATLDTTVRAISPPSIPLVLVSDTVGFIRKLPHDLVASFRSTLEEASSAQLLLYVVDASDASFRSQLAVTREVLASIGVQDVPARLILNKSDKLQPSDIEPLQLEFPDAVIMSTRNPADVTALRQTLVDFFERSMVEQEVFVPYAAQKATGVLRTEVRVLGERHADTGTFLLVKADKTELARLKERLGLSS